MSGHEWRAFVSHGTRTGKLATVSADGSPHVAPIGFLLDNDAAVFTTGRNSVKGRNLLRDGRTALCVDDERLPYAFAVLQGHADVFDDPGQVRHWTARVAARYLGEDRAQEFAARIEPGDDLLIRMRIDKVIAYSGVAD